MTPLGELCLHLDMEVKLCKLVLYGIVFQVPCDALIIAAALHGKDPFKMPSRKVQSERNFLSLLEETTKIR